MTQDEDVPIVAPEYLENLRKAGSDTLAAALAMPGGIESPVRVAAIRAAAAVQVAHANAMAEFIAPHVRAKQAALLRELAKT